jgi:hypothetical protein
MTSNVSSHITALQVGDTVEVLGERFILTGIKKEIDKPAVLTFAQPMEFMKVKRND